MAITIKNEHEIGMMSEAGLVVSEIHTRIQRAIAPGMTTQDLDDIARDTIEEAGAVSSFLGHLGFTGRICASINNEIVHGIPGTRRLEAGDIISVDVGAAVGGYHGDSAWTYPWTWCPPRRCPDGVTERRSMRELPLPGRKATRCDR